VNVVRQESVHEALGFAISLVSHAFPAGQPLSLGRYSRPNPEGWSDSAMLRQGSNVLVGWPVS